MPKYFTVTGLLLILILAACTSSRESNLPSIDVNELQTILPTIAPAQVVAYAEIADDNTLAIGQQVYDANCASCHGADGEGQFPDAPLQPDETGKIGAPPHDSSGHTWHHDDATLYRIIRNGGSGDPSMFYPMPAFGDQLSDTEIESVLAYIKTMWSEQERLIQAQRSLQAAQQSQ